MDRWLMLHSGSSTDRCQHWKGGGILRNLACCRMLHPQIPFVNSLYLNSGSLQLDIENFGSFQLHSGANGKYFPEQTLRDIKKSGILKLGNFSYSNAERLGYRTSQFLKLRALFKYSECNTKASFVMHGFYCYMQWIGGDKSYIKAC